MKSFLAFLALVVIAVGGVGYYLGWFTFDSSSSDGTVNVNTQFHKDKAQEDLEHAKQKVQGAAKDIQERIRPPSKSDKDKGHKSSQDQPAPPPVP